MNGVNVVKVGHKQVVSLIRQGGNHLVMKVVSVSRKPESEDVIRKKGESALVFSREASVLPTHSGWPAHGLGLGGAFGPHGLDLIPPHTTVSGVGPCYSHSPVPFRSLASSCLAPAPPGLAIRDIGHCGLSVAK